MVSRLFFGFGESFSTVNSILNVNDWSPHLLLLKAFLYFGIAGVVLYLESMLVMSCFGGKGILGTLGESNCGDGMGDVLTIISSCLHYSSDSCERCLHKQVLQTYGLSQLTFWQCRIG